MSIVMIAAKSHCSVFTFLNLNFLDDMDDDDDTVHGI